MLYLNISALSSVKERLQPQISTSNLTAFMHLPRTTANQAINSQRIICIKQTYFQDYLISPTEAMSWFCTLRGMSLGIRPRGKCDNREVGKKNCFITATLHIKQQGRGIRPQKKKTLEEGPTEQSQEGFLLGTSLWQPSGFPSLHYCENLLGLARIHETRGGITLGAWIHGRSNQFQQYQLREMRELCDSLLPLCMRCEVGDMERCRGQRSEM